MSNIDILKARAKVCHYKKDDNQWVAESLINKKDISKYNDNSVWFGGEYVFGDTFCRFTGLKDAK